MGWISLRPEVWSGLYNSESLCYFEQIIYPLKLQFLDLAERAVVGWKGGSDLWSPYKADLLSKHAPPNLHVQLHPRVAVFVWHMCVYLICLAVPLCGDGQKHCYIPNGL